MNEPAIIVLSAKKQERLKAVVKNLLDYLTNTTIQNSEFRIHNLAYTLQTGREAMEERLAFTVKDKEMLKKHLKDYLAGETDHIFTGSNRKNKPKIDENEVQQAIATKNPENLARLWTSGASVGWNLIYHPDQKPRKISLPTYPFARERHWIAENTSETAIGSAQLHPLLHANTSNLSEQRFTSVFKGTEHFLADHKVMGEKVLPGTACIEMARIAGEKTLNQEITQLKNTAWLNPFVVKDISQQLHISLFRQGQETGFEIYSVKDKEEVLHSRGTLDTVKQLPPGNRSLSEIRQRCTASKIKEECYALFQSLGLHYGKSFQGIETLYYNAEEALSKITISKNESYILDPGLLDSALQSCIGLSLNEDAPKLMLPFHIKEVNIYEDLPESFWCYVRKSDTAKSSNMESYDVELLNDDGKVLLGLRSFTAITSDGFNIKSPKAKKIAQPTLCFYTTEWKASKAVPAISDMPQYILLAKGSGALADKLGKRLDTEVIAVKKSLSIPYFKKIFKKIRQKVGEKKPAHIIVMYGNALETDYAFISGLLKTMQLEHPKISGKTIGVDSLSTQQSDTLRGILEAEKNTADREVRYTEGFREVKVVMPIPATGKMGGISIKKDGVYLITGGAGGLGQLFAEYIAKTSGVRIILTGRSELNTEKQQAISRINGAEYSVCDVSDKDDVAALISAIKLKHGQLNGVIHAAGILRDSFIIKKDKKDIDKVLAPKIKGVQHLDKATKDEALDFMVYFSSIVGVRGNMGQADYASANAYQDHYAAYRNDLVAKGKRRGHTLSINWPLWKSGGMQIDETQEKYLEKQWGIQPLPALEGIKAFEMLLNTKFSQGIVMYGDQNRMERFLSGVKPDWGQKKNIAPEKKKQDGAQLTQTVLELCAAVLKIDEKELEPDMDFSEYGVDSIMMMRILNRLEEHFNIIVEPTAVLNYPTIALLSEYLESEKHISLKKEIEIPVLPETVRFSRKAQHRFSISETSRKTSGKMAVIGMSCRLPQSDDPDAFWANLEAGKDLITDTPPERWEASAWYSETPAPDKTYSVKGGFIKDAALFDAAYFNISDTDAIAMDPQQRIILELSRELLAHAGYEKGELKSTNTGVYI